MRTNKNRFLTIMAACFGSIVVSSQAHALPLGVTTDDCLGKNLCAYVDTKGHVTCGKCPGQALANPWVIEGRPVGGTALCKDRFWSTSTRHRGACANHGGVDVFLK